MLIINIGTGLDLTINELAKLIASIIGYQGIFIHDLSRFDGTKRKILDIQKIIVAVWIPATDLKTGIELVYAGFLRNITC